MMARVVPKREASAGTDWDGSAKSGRGRGLTPSFRWGGVIFLLLNRIVNSALLV